MAILPFGDTSWPEAFTLPTLKNVKFTVARSKDTPDQSAPWDGFYELRLEGDDWEHFDDFCWEDDDSNCPEGQEEGEGVFMVPDELQHADVDGVYFETEIHLEAEAQRAFVCFVPKMMGLECDDEPLKFYAYAARAPAGTAFPPDDVLDSSWIVLEIPSYEGTTVTIGGQEVQTGFFGSVGEGTFSMTGFGLSNEIMVKVKDIQFYLPSGLADSDSALSEHSAFEWGFGPFGVSLEVIAVNTPSYKYVQFVVYIEHVWEQPFGLPFDLMDVSAGVRYTWFRTNGKPGLAFLATARLKFGCDGALDIKVGLQIGCCSPDAMMLDAGIYIEVDKFTLYDLIQTLSNIVASFGDQDSCEVELPLKDAMESIDFAFKMCLAPLTEVNFVEFDAKCNRGLSVEAAITLFSFAASLEVEAEADPSVSGGRPSFGALKLKMAVENPLRGLGNFLEVISETVQLGMGRALARLCKTAIEVFLAIFSIDLIGVDIDTDKLAMLDLGGLEARIVIYILGVKIDITIGGSNFMDFDWATVKNFFLYELGAEGVSELIGFERPTLKDVINGAMGIVGTFVEFSCEDGTLPEGVEGVVKDCTLNIFDNTVIFYASVRVEACKTTEPGSFISMRVSGSMAFDLRSPPPEDEDEEDEEEDDVDENSEGGGRRLHEEERRRLREEEKHLEAFRGVLLGQPMAEEVYEAYILVTDEKGARYERNPARPPIHGAHGATTSRRHLDDTPGLPLLDDTVQWSYKSDLDAPFVTKSSEIDIASVITKRIIEWVFPRLEGNVFVDNLAKGSLLGPGAWKFLPELTCAPHCHCVSPRLPPVAFQTCMWTLLVYMQTFLT